MTDTILTRDSGTDLCAAPALQRLVDRDGADWTGPLRDWTHPDDRATLDEVRSALATGSPAAADLRILAADGEPHWVSVLAQPTLDHDGQVIGHVAAWRDIHHETALREALMASEERFRLLAETASDIVYASGPDRNVIWVSASIEPALGWKPEELIGTWMSALVHPDDLAWSAERRDRLYAGDPEAEAEGSFVLRLRTRDGGYRWVSTTLTTHRDADGTPLQFTGGMKIIDDVMEERQRLAESEERFRLLAQNVTDVVQLWRDGARAWVSPSITQSLGWSVDEWAAGPFERFVHPDDVEACTHCLGEVERGARRMLYVRLLGADETWHWVQVHAGPYVDADGRTTGVVSSFRVADEEVRAREELVRKATYDELTGALNRASALWRLEGARRADGDRAKFAVLFVDLDGFKDINDNHGHAVGDAVLRAVVGRIRSAMRADDAVARIGGDEFIVLLDGVADVDVAERVAGLVHGAFDEPIDTVGGPLRVSCSIGVAVLRPDEGVEDVIARADRAMYLAKQRGGLTA